MNTVTKKLSRLTVHVSSQADPASENWTWSYLYRGFLLVNNPRTHALSIFTRVNINFLENAWEFNIRVTYWNETKWVFLSSIPKGTALWVHFIKWYFCTYCLRTLSRICLNSFITSEAIQSRCAVLRYSRLTDAQVLHRLLEVCEKEQVRFYLTNKEA